MGYALPLTVCSEPLSSSRPQWNVNSANSYAESGAKGPPVKTEWKEMGVLVS